MLDIGFGIDFGTTNSVVSSFDGRQLQSFTDKNGLPHPSIVWYRGEGVPTIGREAKEEIEHFGNIPGNYFVRSIKSQLQDQAQLNIFGKKYHAWEVAGEIFKFLRKNVDSQSLKSMENAIVTIPLYFNGCQRKHIRKAADSAGINVKNFIHEPFAAVIGYLFSNSDPDSIDRLKNANENILIFDWGGGTLDITLVKLDSGKIFEISSQGCPGTSGDYFDQVLMAYVCDRFQQENNISPEQFKIDEGIQSMFNHEIEFAKISLSKEQKASVTIPGFYTFNENEIPLRLQINRTDFESLIACHIQDAINLVDKVLERPRLTVSQVDRVLLIGGTSKIPLLETKIRNIFGMKVCSIPNADTIISEGAAIISHHNWQPYLVNPLCIQLSDETYYTVFGEGAILKPETAQNEVKLFCTDPRDGEGILILADKLTDTRFQVKDPIRVPVVKGLEEIYKEKVITNFAIDHNLILQVSAQGSIKGNPVYAEYHDLCYGLRFG